MSTKALWAALRRLSDLEAEKRGTTLTTLAHNAGQELEAIERAAKVLRDKGVVCALISESDQPEVDAAADTLTACAKEAP